MSQRGFVYTGTLSEKDLKALLERLKVQVHFTWSLAELEPGEGPPVDLRDDGTAFNDRCEVRWQRLDEEKFLVWVLSDEAQDGIPLSPAEGGWTTEEQKTCLWNLKETAIDPSFDQYPTVGREQGKMSCRVFYREGMATFISPREVMPDEG